MLDEAEAVQAPPHSKLIAAIKNTTDTADHARNMLTPEEWPEYIAKSKAYLDSLTPPAPHHP